MFQLIKKKILKKVNDATKDGRIYIFLTVSGGYFCSLIFILFLISLSYANSLAYFSSFLFLSVVWVSCIVTNYNLHGLEILRLKASDIYFESEPLLVEVDFKNAGKKPRFDIEAGVKDAESEFVTEIGPGESASIKVFLNQRKVGVHSIKKADLYTSFPFGLFKSWKPYRFEKEICIVPTPKYKPLPTEEMTASGEGDQMSSQLNDEFKNHMRYTTEGVGRIDWKIFARRDELLLKEYEGEVSQNFEFNDKQLTKFEKKDRLGFLTYWLLEAEKKGASYSLELGEDSVPKGFGKNHLHRCLRIIAKDGGHP
ncbi:MAG: hypothetical protein ACJAT2_001397 [Bacteriovoracaceae bacterium]|jgi:uncharacterized protein (DUF58 family)